MISGADTVVTGTRGQREQRCEQANRKPQAASEGHYKPPNEKRSAAQPA
jgi:hypothetical protein